MLLCIDYDIEVSIKNICLKEKKRMNVTLAQSIQSSIKVDGKAIKDDVASDLIFK